MPKSDECPTTGRKIKTYSVNIRLGKKNHAVIVATQNTTNSATS